jgi:hypothetical protein
LVQHTVETLSRNSLSPWTRWLAILFALGLLTAAILGVALDATEETVDTIFWVLFTVGGAALVAAGVYAFARGSAWLGIGLGLITVGAIAGSVVLFWSIVVEIAGLILVVLAALDARRLAARPTT